MKYSIRLNEDRLPYLVKEAAVCNNKGAVMQSPDAIFRFLCKNEDFEDLPEEHVMLLCFNTNQQKQYKDDRYNYRHRGMLPHCLSGDIR